eukprot:4596-Heterococcus_DN1.PRE.1
MHLCMATRTLNVYDILEKLRPECSPEDLVLLAAQFIKDKVLDAASTHNSSSSSGYLKKLEAVKAMMAAIEANPTLDNLEQLTFDLSLNDYGFTIAQCKKGGNNGWMGQTRGLSVQQQQQVVADWQQCVDEGSCSDLTEEDVKAAEHILQQELLLLELCQLAHDWRSLGGESLSTKYTAAYALQTVLPVT